MMNFYQLTLTLIFGIFYVMGILILSEIFSLIKKTMLNKNNC